MAEKRMFTQKIIDSDPFLDMPLSTQALYFHLNMRADDDGFINNPKRIQRTIGASDDDLKLLIAKRFVICFENGVIVIKHWRMHNTLRKDRYKPTQYQEEYALLDLKPNNSYTEKADVDAVATNWQPTDNQLEPQCSVGECSVDKCSVGECSTGQPPTPTQITYESLVKKYGKSFVDERVERSRQYSGTDNIETVEKWCEEDYKHKKKSNSFNNFPQRQYTDSAEIEKKLLQQSAKESDP